MRNLEKLWDVYNMLSRTVNANGIYGSEFLAALCMKRVFAVAGCLYPEHVKKFEDRAFYLSGEGILCEDGCSLEDTGELIMHYAASQSCLTDYLMCYYVDNPFWKVKYVSFSFDDCEAESDLPEREFLEKYRDLFEPKVFESYCKESTGHPLKDFYSFFEISDSGYSNDGMILMSKLLPFYYKVKEEALKVEPELCGKIEEVVSMMSHWLPGQSLVIKDSEIGCELEWAYFIGEDTSGDCFNYAYGSGVLDAEIAIVVAGEILDRAIFALDEKLKFLPDDIRGMKKIPEWEVALYES